jgi:DNA helicase-2/ATP-dependent DNA helicase PcrA
MPWQDGLLDDQIGAAAHVGTHALLLAGPGTGKTHTLTRHLLKLVLEDNVPPNEILAIAFTRINAYDLNRSVAGEFTGQGLLPPRISTLHSFALSQLLRNSRLVRSLPQPIRIADDYEERWIIRADLGAVLGLNDREVRAKLAELSADWHDLRLDRPPQQPADPQFMGAWLRHREVYGYTLRAELVWQLKHAMEENPEQFDMGAGIRYLLVDEYQDLNQCDLTVVAAIASMGAEVYCAGDDDQSIYSFRGAYPGGIRRFPQDFQPSTPLDLEVCLRSDRGIIALGQYVANLDPNRLPKSIRPRDDAGEGDVHLLRFTDQDAEARGVAAICAYLLNHLRYLREDILILLRSDHRGRYSTPIVEALRQLGLPSNVRGERGGLLDENDGRHLLALLRLAQNELDDLAWRTLLHLVRPRNRIGASTIQQMFTRAQDQRVRFSQILRQVEQVPETCPRGSYIAEDMAAIRALIAPLIALPQPDPNRQQDVAYRSSLLRQTLSGIDALSRVVIPNESTRRMVMDHIAIAAERWNAITLADIIASLTSPEDTLDQEVEAGVVNILTMHRAKGLSAEAVIVVGAEEELIPGDAAGEAYNDERRLLYVSLTRAKHFLVATYCNRRTGRQRHSGSSAGNPQRHLTPFLRNALRVESGPEYIRSISQ